MNLCGIYEEFLWKSMIPQHIVEGQCGISVEIIKKFGRKSSSTVWNLMQNSDKRIQKGVFTRSLTEHPVAR